jgi:undecaprenyl diphosphate synthase
MADAMDVRKPRHVAIIMDGNGRWAKGRGLPRTEGHRRGLDVAKAIVRAAREAGIKAISLFVFSTENWRRAEDEVDFLMRLIQDHLGREFDFYREMGARILHSGDLAGLPSGVRGEIERVVRETAVNDSIVLNLAINYGGKSEIVRAVNRALRLKALAGDPPDLSEEDIAAALDSPSLPPPDLIIRTSGEFRMSNFMTWQSAYAELYFSEKYWPDWTAADFDLALKDYSLRKRLFGGNR